MKEPEVHMPIRKMPEMEVLLRQALDANAKLLAMAHVEIRVLTDRLVELEKRLLSER